jgi:two-component system sensor histidine kinase/response regulator
VSKKAHPKILVVDDDSINLQILAQALAEQYQVILATDGKKALELSLSQNPDLVLLDISLPKMDGYQVCRALKNNSKTKRIPVIFITGYDSDESELKGLQLGAADYFTKPFKIPLVLARTAMQIDLKKKTDLLETLVDLDGLTGISNRRMFDRKYAEEWRRAKRRGSPLSLCIMDVDFFKQYNDNYGHAMGDKCLKLIAQELQKVVRRAGESVARYGGEEFVLIMPDIDEEHAVDFANKLRQKIEILAIPHEFSSCSEKVTMSFGVAYTSMGDTEMSKEDLLTAADEQLYIAKNQGRNCVSAIHF